MSVIESVKNYIMTCPYLAELARVNVDFLPDDPNTYSVEETPTNTIIRTYLDGSSERQFVFVFASRLYYSDEIRNNIDNSGFFEKFEKWLEENQAKGNLPELPEKMTASSIEINSNGYLYGIDNNMAYARYQIQLRLLYDKE